MLKVFFLHRFLGYETKQEYKNNWAVDGIAFYTNFNVLVLLVENGGGVFW